MRVIVDAARELVVNFSVMSWVGYESLIRCLCFRWYYTGSLFGSSVVICKGTM